MIEDLRITVLAENTTGGSDLLAEHGLAFWIEADGHRILFDTGQGKVLLPNAARLGIPLRETEIVVLSHGHYDHTGGLTTVLDAAPHVDVFLHPSALKDKYARTKSLPHRSIGIPDLDETALRRQVGSLTWTRLPTEVIRGMHVTGEIPRRNDFEDTGGPFYLNPICTEADPLLDDQALFIETSAGLVVLLGCAHAGVVNTLDYIAELTGLDRFHAVLGGMHLVRATTDRLKATVQALARYRVEQIGPAHCTGMRGTTHLWSKLSDRCFACSVGSAFTVQSGSSNVR